MLIIKEQSLWVWGCFSMYAQGKSILLNVFYSTFRDRKEETKLYINEVHRFLILAIHFKSVKVKYLQLMIWTTYAIGQFM